MFSGIVEGVGRIDRVERRGGGRRMTIAPPRGFGRLRRGESVAVAGVCLTVAAPTSGGFESDLSPETLARTTLGAAAAGADVNLEADVVARHVARLREFAPAPGPGVGAGDLSRWGYGGAR